MRHQERPRRPGGGTRDFRPRPGGRAHADIVTGRSAQPHLQVHRTHALLSAHRPQRITLTCSGERTLMHSNSTISVTDVSHSFTGRDGMAVPAVDDVSFTVQPGEFV